MTADDLGLINCAGDQCNKECIGTRTYARLKALDSRYWPIEALTRYPMAGYLMATTEKGYRWWRPYCPACYKRQARANEKAAELADDEAQQEALDAL